MQEGHANASRNLTTLIAQSLAVQLYRNLYHVSVTLQSCCLNMPSCSETHSAPANCLFATIVDVSTEQTSIALCMYCPNVSSTPDATLYDLACACGGELSVWAPLPFAWPFACTPLACVPFAWVPFACTPFACCTPFAPGAAGVLNSGRGVCEAGTASHTGIRSCKWNHSLLGARESLRKSP